MPPRLLPSFELSQVVFVHDYIQLVFGNEAYFLYNAVVVCVDETEHQQGDAGFADSIVSLIGRTVVEIAQSQQSALVINFEHGAQVRVLRAYGAKGPEAFQFKAAHGLIVVEHNE